MSTIARRRLTKDYKALKKDPPSGITAAPTSTDFLLWHAVIFGPPETPFEDGAFNLTLEFTEEYPTKPPKVKFVTEIFHPNVYADGSICIDILQDKWTAVYQVSGLLTSIQSLLDEPNPKSPANKVAADLYVENRIEYEKRVLACVEQSWIEVDAELEADEAAKAASA